MTLPVQQKTWTISANNRLVYSSLVTIMGGYLKGMADFLLANGYTCKGSSTGVAAAMDGVNRWSTVADASVRGGNTTTAQSWMVLTDGNGQDICLAYAGTTDDRCRFSFSPGGNYVAAGTATFTPTATDELTMFTTASIIDGTTSLDRIWHGWVDSEAKLCRFAILRNTTLVTVWGVELLDSLATVTYSPATWGFGYIGAQFSIAAGAGFAATPSANSRGGVARINGVNCSLGGGIELFLGAITSLAVQKPELQGATGYVMFPLSVGSNTATMQGPAGNLFDWWSQSSAGIRPGVWVGSLDWIILGDGSNATAASGLAWPWDGVTYPQVA